MPTKEKKVELLTITARVPHKVEIELEGVLYVVLPGQSVQVPVSAKKDLEAKSRYVRIVE